MDRFESISKRRSFHRFGKTEPMTRKELDALKGFIAGVRPLDEEIGTKIVIVPAGETSTHCGAEYCILFFSEKKEGHLRNIGYIGEQIDLWCTANGIGSLWLGFGKPNDCHADGMEYVIMMAVSKVAPDRFRKDLSKVKRKPTEKIFSGELPEGSEIVRFAPSACNSQPWYCESAGGSITVFRTEPKSLGILPPRSVAHYNCIDIGIFLFMLEVCLEHAGIAFERTLFPDNVERITEKVRAAEYRLK